MAQLGVSTQDVRAFVADLVRAEKLSTIEQLNQAANADDATAKKPKDISETAVYREIVEAFESGPGSDLAGSTVWGLYNAATHWIDHTRGRSEETRLAESWLGKGATLRRRASKLAESLC